MTSFFYFFLHFQLWNRKFIALTCFSSCFFLSPFYSLLVHSNQTMCTSYTSCTLQILFEKYFVVELQHLSLCLWFHSLCSMCRTLSCNSAAFMDRESRCNDSFQEDNRSLKRRNSLLIRTMAINSMNIASPIYTFHETEFDVIY